MSKIKENILREEELRLEYMFSYAKWLDKYLQPMSEDDINKLEEELSPSSVSKRIISNNKANNNNYNPKLGA